jgi:hypothetical protein
LELSKLQQLAIPIWLYFKIHKWIYLFYFEIQIYKTFFNFSSICYYSYGISAAYRQMYFDFNSSKFYVAVSGLEIIQVFDINCVLKQNFSLGTNISAYGFNFFNSRFYISTKAAN